MKLKSSLKHIMGSITLKTKKSERCIECGEATLYCGNLNSEDQCSECSIICEVCGVSSYREPLSDVGLCDECTLKEKK